jgi:hypothetical protein
MPVIRRRIVTRYRASHASIQAFTAQAEAMRLDSAYGRSIKRAVARVARTAERTFITGRARGAVGDSEIDILEAVSRIAAYGRVPLNHCERVLVARVHPWSLAALAVRLGFRMPTYWLPHSRSPRQSLTGQDRSPSRALIFAAKPTSDPSDVEDRARRLPHPRHDSVEINTSGGRMSEYAFALRLKGRGLPHRPELHLMVAAVVRK